MTYLLWALAAAAAAYQTVALLACIRHALRSDPAPSAFPAISILKTVRGIEPQLTRALESNAAQAYRHFELIVGSNLPGDPALVEAGELGAQTVVSTTRTRNGKVGVLIDMNRVARHPVRVINDADISVPADYLTRIAGALEQPGIGLVTCLYRASASTVAGRWEALGIATDFVPSVLVAPLFGVTEFALGSTIAVLAADLPRIGGLETLAPYIADDYQLGKRISALGRRVWLTRMVVETDLGASTWRGVWRHQVRWARTIRLSRGAYAGLPFTNATLWALLLIVAGEWPWGLALLTLRFVTGLAGGVAVLACPITLKYWPLMPLRDLFGLAVWVAGMFGNRVFWRGEELTLDREGRIIEPSQK